MKCDGGGGEAVLSVEPSRVVRSEFIAAVAKRSGVPAKVVREVYDAGIDEILAIVARGDQLVLQGFGRFYAQRHKGHPVQFFGSKDQEINDYVVLKFSAARWTNRKLGDEVEAPVLVTSR